MIQMIDGGFALAGRTLPNNGDNFDIWIIKTDGSGTVQWDLVHGGRYDDEAFSLIQTADGGLAIAGSTISDSTGSDMWLLKIKEEPINSSTESDNTTQPTSSIPASSTKTSNSTEHTPFISSLLCFTTIFLIIVVERGKKYM